MTTAVETVQQRVAECQGLVRSVALQVHRKLPPNVDLDDVIAYGQVGLAEAARDFDPSRGNRFSTYAYYRIRGAMYDGLAKMTWFGRGHHQRVRYEQMAGESLAEDSQRPQATDEDGELRWFRNLSRALAVVHLLAHRERSEDGVASITESGRFAPPIQAMDHEISQKLNDLIDHLPHEEGAIIRAAYFEGLSLQEAGQRLGISKSWTTRLHAKALQRLARSLKLLGLAS
jgi:RNA polymerase sigma factor FliA